MPEHRRLEALRQYAILDTTPEEPFERLAQLAADLLRTPRAAVVFLDADRIWTKASVGCAHHTRPREQGFCTVAVEEGADLLVVLDAAKDPRFAANPAVVSPGHLRFYVGAVFRTPDGLPLGALCVMDDRPRRRPSATQLKQLSTLAAMVVDELELRRARSAALAQERLLELTEELAGIGHWRSRDPDAPSIWSDEVFAILGSPRREPAPSCADLVSMLAPEDRDRVAAELRPVWAVGSEVATTARLLRPDGLRRDVAIHARRYVEPGGLAEVVGTIQDVTEQLAALRRSERREAHYRLLTEHAADVISRIRLDGSSPYISPGIQKLIGYTPAEMEGRPAHDFVAPEDRRLLIAALERIGEGAAEQTIEVRAQHKDGRLIWVEVRFSGVREDGGALETIAVIRDIERRKSAQAALAATRSEVDEQARRAELAERIAGLGHWRMDLETGEREWSEQMFVIYGLPPGEIPPFPQVRAMVLEEDRETFSARLKRAAQSGEGYSDELTRIRRPDGAVRHLLMNGQVQRQPGKHPALVGTIQDVTDQVEVKAALAASEARYRSLAENAGDLIIQMTARGVLTYVSPASNKILCRAPEDLVGQPAISIAHPDDAAAVGAAMRGLIEGQGRSGSLRLEFRAARPDGREIWLEATPTPIFDESGVMCGINDVLRDVTDRKRLECDLQKARAEAEAAAAVKGEFLANMSHELRTPLTSIIGYTGLAMEQGDLGQTARGYVERVSEASRALLCLVNDILDFSKLEAGQINLHPQPTAASQLGQATLDLFAPQAGAKDIHLTFDGAEADATVLVDPDRLRQVLLNLVGNAVKFTAHGGVTLTMRHDPEAQRLHVAVSDTGEGIPPEKVDALFKRFSQIDGSLTRTQGGTGLGLAICKGLVEAMGGEIGVESRSGEGSRFWFWVPARVTKAAGTGHAGEDPGLNLGGLRVLVVDDHPTNRELARLFLAAAGAEITEAADGEEAVERASELPFDVILMDVRMPRLGGAEALARIRSEPGPNDATPILAFTADADRSAFERLRAQGFEDVIPKPLEPVALLVATARAATLEFGGLESRDVA